MGSQGLTVKIKIDGLRETLRAFDALPPSASNELRNESLQIARKLANNIKRNADGDRQSRLLSNTVAAKSDRVPTVTAGGSGNVKPIRHHGHKPVKAYQVLFGSEFGAHASWRFRPRRTTGYWFYPAVDDMRDEMTRRWLDATDVILRKWTEGV